MDIQRASRLFPAMANQLSRIQNPLQLPFLYLGNLSNENEQLSASLSEVGVSSDDVDLAYRLVLQRGPETSEVVQEYLSTSRSPFEVVSRLICSPEWAERVNQLFRAAFPATPRLWHLHAPKTGGTAFFDAGYRAGWGYINMNQLETPGRDLRTTAEAVRFVDGKCVLVSGHKTAWHVQPAMGPFDSGVVFLRDPLSRAVSFYNFVLDVIAGRENVLKVPPDEFLKRGFDPTSIERTRLAGFFELNQQCFFLASDRSCRSALKVAEANGIELALMEDVSRYCMRFFGVTANTVNASTGTLKVSELPPRLAEAIVAENAEDLALYSIALKRRSQTKEV